MLPRQCRFTTFESITSLCFALRSLESLIFFIFFAEVAGGCDFPFSARERGATSTRRVHPLAHTQDIKVAAEAFVAAEVFDGYRNRHISPLHVKQHFGFQRNVFHNYAKVKVKKKEVLAKSRRDKNREKSTRLDIKRWLFK